MNKELEQWIFSEDGGISLHSIRIGSVYRNYTNDTIRNWYQPSSMRSGYLAMSAEWYTEHYIKRPVNVNIAKTFEQQRNYCIREFVYWLKKKNNKLKNKNKHKEIYNNFKKCNIYNMEEEMETMEQRRRMLEYINGYATAKERYIYDVMLKIRTLKREGVIITDYPGGPVRYETFLRHRTQLIKKMKGFFDVKEEAR